MALGLPQFLYSIICYLEVCILILFDLHISLSNSFRKSTKVFACVEMPFLASQCLGQVDSFEIIVLYLPDRKINASLILFSV